MPPQLAADAAANPGGWGYEISGSLVSDPDGYVPAQAIIGAFAVGPDGRPTGEYARNAGHGLKIIDEPVCLATGVRSSADPQTLIFRRAAVHGLDVARADAIRSISAGAR
jgi:hypothetical protein